MKTRNFLLILLIANFSCETNKSGSDAEKDKMIGEVKEVVSTIFKALEEVDFDKANEQNLDSPDFVFIINGKIYNYEEVLAFKPAFNELLNQKATIIDEKYALLDNSTVLYTTNCSWVSNYKDGHAILQDPWVMQFIIMKIDDRWRVISIIESGVEHRVENTEISNQLNQVELHKQYIGNWESELGKDTLVLWEGKPYGTGLECYLKMKAKGKVLIEGKQIWAYNNKADEFILSELNKGVDNGIYSSYFISKDKCEMLPYNDVSNPENAPLKWEDEFKSPDMFVHKTIKDNNIVKTDTYTRVK